MQDSTSTGQTGQRQDGWRLDGWQDGRARHDGWSQSGWSTAPEQPLLDEQLRHELRATLLAVHELGPEYDAVAADVIVDRVMPAIRQRLRRQPLPAAAPGHPNRLWTSMVVGAVMLAAFAVAGHSPHEHGMFTSRYGGYHLSGGHRMAPSNGIVPPPAPAAPPAPPAPPS